MKRFFGAIALVCLMAVSSFAGVIPITGTIRFANGNLMNGRIRFTLSYSTARDTTTSAMVLATRFEFPVANGALPSSAKIVPNDILQPANTFYTAEYVSSTGTVLATNVFYVQGTSFDIGSATPTPLTTSNISFGSFTGLDQVTTKRLNSIRFCDQFAGATAGAKIVACIADLPSTGGVADARSITGTQSITQNMFSGVTKPVVLMLGAATFTLSTAQTVPSNTQIVGAGRGVTAITISANGISAFTMGPNVTRTTISDLTTTGPGAGSTVPCVQYDEAYENVLQRVNISLCNVGVRYKDGGTISASAFSNAILDSLIISANTINIDLQSASNNTNLYNVTFGGGPAQTGIKVVDSDGLKVYGGDCEGVSVACIDLDASSAALYTGHVISGVHFESNASSGGEIRVGNTNAINGLLIEGCTFHGNGVGQATYPVNLVRANHVDLIGNVVTSGYSTSSDPFLGTVTNVSSNNNRWSSATGYFTFQTADTKIGGTDITTAPAANLEVQGTSGVTISRDSTSANVGQDLKYRQKDANGTWVTHSFIRSNLSVNTAGAVSSRLIGSIKIAGVDTEIFNFNSGILDFEKDVRTSGYVYTVGVTQANLGTPSNGAMIYCSDCTIASPCAGGGTGALAKRLNGAWVCN